MSTEQSIMAVILAARPAFRSRHDKVAFAIHAAFLSAGYVLNSTGAAALSDDALSASSSADEVGIDNWNEEGDSQPLHLEVNVGEYVEDNEGTNNDSQFKNLGKLVADVNDQILGKLGGSPAASSSNQQSSSKAISRDDRDRPSIGVVHPEEPCISPPTSG